MYLVRFKNVFFLFCITLLILQLSFSAQAQLDVVKIGVLAPLTGTTSADGEEMVRGAKLAAKEINASGGVAGYEFKIITADTGNQTTDAVTSGINFLDANGVDCIVTGYASTSNFEIEKMSELNMPYILSAQATQTRSIISKNPEKYPTVWSLMPSYDAYGSVPPEMFEKWDKEGVIDLGDREVAIITSDCEYSYNIYKSMKNNFAKLGWKITLDEVVPFQEIFDWRSIISKIQKNSPDVVINTDYPPANAATFLKQFRENPTNSLVFLQYAPSVPEFLELTKDLSTGVLYTIFSSIINSPKSEKSMLFLEKFREEYNVESGPYGVNLYEEIYLFADALEKVGDPKDHVAIGNAIGETDKEISAGRLKFDLKTHLAIQGEDFFPLQFYQLWEGERVLLMPEKYSTGEFQIPPWMTKK